MKQEESHNLVPPPDPFFHGEMDVGKKCRLIQPPRPIRVKVRPTSKEQQRPMQESSNKVPKKQKYETRILQKFGLPTKVLQSLIAYASPPSSNQPRICYTEFSIFVQQVYKKAQRSEMKYRRQVGNQYQSFTTQGLDPVSISPPRTKKLHYGM